MTTRLAKHFKELRLQRGLKPGQLAALAGCKNISKNGSKIVGFETTGDISKELLTQLTTTLEVDPELVNQLIAQDRQQWYEEWLQWVDAPVEPYMVVRLMAAMYNRLSLPRGVTQEQAEQITSDFAKEKKLRCCLVWNRRLTVYFDRHGEIEQRTHAEPGIVNSPCSSIGGRSFIFGGNLTQVVAIELPQKPPATGN